MDDEKKTNLDELPNLGSEPEIKITPLRVMPSRPEPRIENLKSLNDSEKADALSERWLFENKKSKWLWLLLFLAFFALEKSGYIWKLHTNSIRVEKPADNLLAQFNALAFESEELEFLLKHPLVFAILIPFFFKFKGRSNDSFELTFNGVTAVKTIDVPVFEFPVRVKMKWNDIKSVEKTVVKGREVLILHNLEGPAAQLIWDIDMIKKKVVKQVLTNLVSAKHPMRIFIEKEIT